MLENGCERVRLRLLIIPLLLISHPAAAFDPWSDAARYELEYRIELSAIATQSGRLRVWVPHPAENADQAVVRAHIDSPWPYGVHRDSRGNRIVYLEGSGKPDRDLLLRFTVDRQPSNRPQPVNASVDNPANYMRPARLIPLEGVIRDLAVQQSAGLRSSEQKVRAFYEYVVKTMRYNKEGSGWGRGDAVWACANKRGNCTDFHSLLIGMALSQGIPARFVIGFPIPADRTAGEVLGYHCWAQYYRQEKGWVPLDASEANKSGKIADYFGALPSDRVEFTVGRDLVLEPPQSGPPLNYFVYPYAELDGVPIEQVPASVRFRRSGIENGQNERQASARMK